MTTQIHYLSLNDILEELKQANLYIKDNCNKVDGLQDLQWNHISCSSKEVTNHSVFLAYKGIKTDGHQYIHSAVENGCRLTILENLEEVSDSKPACNWIQVKSSRAAWTHLAARILGNPEKKLNIFGVTGTNGKTSVVWMARHLLSLMIKSPVLSMGTLGLSCGDSFEASTHTTPDPSKMFDFFSKGVDKGAQYAFMEVSSHGIAQEKVASLKFAGAAFTSFSRDHMDFHPSMEHYWQTKWQLFSKLLKDDGIGVINNALKERISENASKNQRCVWYSCSDTSDGKKNTAAIKILGETSKGSQVRIRYQSKNLEGIIPYFGKYASENFLAAWLLVSQICKQTIPSHLWLNIPQIPGRLERVEANAPNKPKVFIDYAHTPDALYKTLTELKELKPKRLIAVFGCGGDRDKGKRPQMGEIASKLADFSFITNDNPRYEPAIDIAQAISAGFTDKSRFTIILDRANAINKAIKTASYQDLILIAGKGHEDYQEINGTKTRFKDTEVAKQALNFEDKL